MYLDFWVMLAGECVLQWRKQGEPLGMLLCPVTRLDPGKFPIRGWKSCLSSFLQYVALRVMKENDFFVNAWWMIIVHYTFQLICGSADHYNVRCWPLVQARAARSESVTQVLSRWAIFLSESTWEIHLPAFRIFPISFRSYAARASKPLEVIHFHVS